MLTVLIPVKVKVAKYKCPPEIEWALCQDGDAVDTSFLEVIPISLENPAHWLGKVSKNPFF